MRIRLRGSPVPSILVGISLFMTACAPSSPPPTTASAKPAEAAKPAEPSKPAEAAKPASASPAAAAPAAPSPAAAPAAPSPAAAAAGTPPVISLGTANNIQAAPWFVGVDKGIFLKHGVDLKLRILNTGIEVVKAVQTGEIDVGTGGFTTIIPALDQGIKFKAFLLTVSDALDPAPDDQFLIAARPESGITKVQDLKGRRVGAATGAASDAYVRAALQKAGIPLDAVEFVNVTPANMVSAYESGVDVVVSTEPYGEMLLAKHPEAKVVQRGGGLFAQRLLVYSTEEWVAKNRQLAENIIAGYVEAAFVTRTQPSVVADVVPRWQNGLDGQLGLKAVSHIPFDPCSSSVVRASWEADNKLLVDQKKLKEPIAFERAFDTGLLDEVVKNYPQLLTDLKPIP